MECLLDLQETAARLLVVGGRLCFWMPDFAEQEGEEPSDKDATDGNSQLDEDAAEVGLCSLALAAGL